MIRHSFFLVLWLTVFVCGTYAETAAPDSGQKNYDRAVEYFKQEQYDLAIEFFQKSLQDSQGPAIHSRIYNLIGLAYMRQGVSIASAIGSFEQAMKLDPGFAEPYFNAASAYAGTDTEPAKAAEYFKKTIEVDPHYYKAYFGLGWFSLMNEEDAGKATDYFKVVLEKDPQFAEAHYGMGLAYIRMRQPFMALGSVSQLRDLKRDDLASTLEKAITEVSPPEDAVTSDESGPAAEGGAADSANPPPARGGKSPFEVIMRGKVVPLDEEPAPSN